MYLATIVFKVTMSRRSLQSSNYFLKTSEKETLKCNVRKTFNISYDTFLNTNKTE